MRKDIYEALRNAQQNTPANSLDAPSQRLLDRMLRDKRRAGLGLPDNQQTKFKELKTKISNLCIEFHKNCDEEKGFLLFTEKELDGLPQAILDSFEKVVDAGESKLKVTHKTPDIVPLLRNAKNPETRKKGYLSYEDRSTINTGLFQEIMELRKEAAAVAGYKTWADYIIEPKMAKTAKTAIDFLDDLLVKIKPIGEKERDELLKLKKEDCEAQGIPFDDTFYAWDYRYLDRLYVEKHFQLNDELVKQYLPVEHVVKKVLDIYQQLLSIQITPVNDSKTWHKEVTVFAVWDTLDSQGKEPSSDAFLGYLYLDLFPREDKVRGYVLLEQWPIDHQFYYFQYGHAAVWGLVPGTVLTDGSRQKPLAAMVANLAKVSIVVLRWTATAHACSRSLRQASLRF
jgi:Zn-dependent oligopeptidase